MFLSKVPNCKDIKTRQGEAPGPGYYEKLANNKDNSVISDNKRSTSEGPPT